MITVNTTVRNEVEGLRINQPLEDKLMAGMNDFEKARQIGEYLKTYLAFSVAVVDGIPIDQALLYVTSNTERIS